MSQPVYITPDWTSSAGRTAIVGFPLISKPGQPAPSTSVTWPSKASADQLDYSLDLTQWLTDVPGDTLATASVSSISPNGNANDMASAWTAIIDSTLVTTFLSAGVPGTTYSVIVSIDTAESRALNVLASITINANQPAASAINPTLPPDALTSDLGVPLLGDDGTLLLLA